MSAGQMVVPAPVMDAFRASEAAWKAVMDCPFIAREDNSAEAMAEYDRLNAVHDNAVLKFVGIFRAYV